MNKSQRLFALLTLLRARRYAVTARDLAEAMHVSQRTLYRDIQSLIAAGVPICGEAGVGYLLQSGAHLPPLMFTEKEMMALELGMRMVRGWSDQELAEASRSASAKIHSVLPDARKQQVENLPLLVPDSHLQSDTSIHSQMLRHATDQKYKVEVVYIANNHTTTQRRLQPLGQMFWGKVWTLIAWCELRQDYRQFRIDRIQTLTIVDEAFATSATRSLPHYVSLHAPQDRLQ
ncbi:helix-turn-helix transcriptional regulator [Vibrio ostreicida]|uniref:helix-turn-helix transcriptional regulator n=1 Tax=Vibrio ostreicida TaxID=526588 RepID=UPI000970FA5E|nr:YafY family protein [Vibrio ostreicida]